MINIEADFWQGTQGKLFRLCRTPEKIKGHILYLPPLFEDSNRNRHVYTQAAINAYQLGFQSVIFDLFGCGDSSGDLVDASLLLWQKDILVQIKKVKEHSSMPVIVCVCYSAALLLTNAIFEAADFIELWHPEFNGKKYVQQFKRMELAADLSKSSIKTTKTNLTIQNNKIIDIAGYVMQQQLLSDISHQEIHLLAETKTDCLWLEWLMPGASLARSRKVLMEAFSKKSRQVEFVYLSDDKHWQAGDLIIPKKLITASVKHLQKILLNFNDD